MDDEVKLRMIVLNQDPTTPALPDARKMADEIWSSSKMATLSKNMPKCPIRNELSRKRGENVPNFALRKELPKPQPSSKPASTLT